MLNFNYQNQTKIIFGKDTENQVGAELATYTTKILLHYGGASAKASGLYDRIVASLVDSGITFVSLGGVKPNPRAELVYEGIELCRKENIVTKINTSIRLENNRQNTTRIISDDIITEIK